MTSAATSPDTLIVLMGDEVAGLLTRAQGGLLHFSYEPDYAARRNATPLSVAMPLGGGTYAHEVVAPWLWGLLPDNERVLARWAKHYRVPASNPFFLLATPVGEDCAGAVRFVTSGRLDAAQSRSGRVRWLDDDEIAERIRELRRDRESWLGAGFSGRFSLAGAQSKTALIVKGDRFGEPSGRIPTTHILKPGVADLEHQDLDEHLCLEAARRLGLTAARSRLMHFGGETAIVVERYDRRRKGREIIRVHQEDLCQALGLDPAMKYQADGGPGPAGVVALFHREMPWEVANAAVWRFAEALAWNWLIAGTDAHAKNYSLLLSGDEVRLSPLYDVASALPYGHHEKKLRFAMKLGGSYLVDVTQNPWPKVAAELGLDPVSLTDRVREMAAHATGAVADAVAEVGMPEAAEFTDRLVSRIEGRARRCERVLKGRAQR